MLVPFALLLAAVSPARLVVVEADALDTDFAALFAGGSNKAEVIRAKRAADADFQQAQGLVKRAHQEWRAGQAFALGLKTDDAIGKYETALALFARGAVGITDFTPVAQCHIDLGAAWLVKDKSERAAAAFKRALSLSPQTTVDPGSHNPQVVSMFRQLQRDAQRSAPGAMTIVGQPAGASVLLDGAAKGVIPLSIRNVSAGEHVLSVYYPGYQRFAEFVAVAAGSSVRREVFLPKLETSLESVMLSALDSGQPEAEKALASSYDGREVIVVSALRARAKNAVGVVSPVLSAASLEALASAVNAWLLPTTPRQPPEVVASIAPVASPTHAFVAILPFGVGQFAEGRPGAASAFLVSEVVLLAANIVSAAIVLSAQGSAGTSPDAPRDRALQVVNLASFGVLLGTIVVGGIDGYLHRTERAK